MNAAYREVQIALANAGKQTFVQDYSIMTIPIVAVSDPGLEITVGFTGTTGNVANPPVPNATLPSDLIEPYILQERQNGSTDMFGEMDNMTGHGGLPSYPQEAQLRFWEWRGDSINFLGATQLQDVKMRYKKGLAPFTITPVTAQVNTSGYTVTYASGNNFPTTPSWNGQTVTIAGTPYTVAFVASSTSLTLTASAGSNTNVAFSGPSSFSGNIGILGATNAIAYMAAALALKPRGSPLADGYSTAGENYKEKLVTEENRQQQYTTYRRRSFSSRSNNRRLAL